MTEEMTRPVSTGKQQGIGAKNILGRAVMRVSRMQSKYPVTADDGLDARNEKDQKKLLNVIYVQQICNV